MILTHESGSQEDQFDEKKWRQKISWDYPFKHAFLKVNCSFFFVSRSPYTVPYFYRNSFLTE